MKVFFAKHRKKIFTLLVTLTALELLVSILVDWESFRIVEGLPWAIGLTVVSESLFIIGIAIMAYAMNHSIGINPLKWRSHFKHVTQRLDRDHIFWTGFWVNSVGGFGTGVVWLFAVLITLPPNAWGIVWLPLADIMLTISLRAAVLDFRSGITKA